MTDATDPHNLQRFVDAQNPVYDQVRAELRAGCKTSHWMWFVFPQLKELGRSAIARHYGIASAAEALAYWRHPLLGARLAECSEIVCALDRADLTAHDIFHSPDDLKFRSCMTLFRQVTTLDEPESVFERALQRFFNGRPDEQTIELLALSSRR